jgi:hypothetical protein
MMHLALILSFVQPRNVRALRSFEGDHGTHLFVRLMPSITPLSCFWSLALFLLLVISSILATQRKPPILCTLVSQRIVAPAGSMGLRLSVDLMDLPLFVKKGCCSFLNFYATPTVRAHLLGKKLPSFWSISVERVDAVLCVDYISPRFSSFNPSLRSTVCALVRILMYKPF